MTLTPELEKDFADLEKHLKSHTDGRAWWNYPPTWELFQEGGNNPLARIRKALESVDAELERTRVQLAGCGVAALGYIDEKHIVKEGGYGWSASYGDVLKLRREYDMLKQSAVYAGKAGELRMALERIAEDYNFHPDRKRLLISLLEQALAGKKMNQHDSDIQCPLCGEKDFDKVGLMLHILNWNCDDMPELEKQCGGLWREYVCKSV